MPRTSFLTAIAAALCAFAVGCGGDDAPTKADYVKDANAICKEGSEKNDAALEELGDSPSDQEILDFATDVATPNSRETVEQLRELGYPEGDEELLSGLYDELDSFLDQIEEDPEAAFNEGLTTEETDKELAAYGLTDCASS